MDVPPTNEGSLEEAVCRRVSRGVHGMVEISETITVGLDGRNRERISGEPSTERVVDELQNV